MIDALGEAYCSAHAVRMLTDTLNGGFSTVRKIGIGSHARRVRFKLM